MYPVELKDFALLRNIQSELEVCIPFHEVGSGGLSPEVRRPSPEADHSSPPSDDFEKERSYTSISPYGVSASVGISLPFLDVTYSRSISLKTQSVVLFLVCSYPVK